ncbi:MAG: LysR substrate-binding domain-containing protein [Burkholderiaceae bacterium]
MNVTFRQLRVFSEVVRHRSFAKAAAELHLSAPAVSMQVRDLETAIGLPLFDRAGRKVALTLVGEYFVVYARRILATLKEAEEAMARFTHLESGRLTVGMVSTAMYFVPRLLARFHQEHPGVDVQLRIAQNREQMYRMLGDGDIDLAIMGRPPHDVPTRAEIFASHPFVFIAPPGHPLLSVGHPPLSALAPFPFVAREPESGTRNAMDRFFESRGFTPRITMQMDSNEGIKQAVAAGLGISFLSLHALGLELQTGALAIVHVPETPVMRNWTMVRLPGRALSPAAEAFRYFVMAHAPGELARWDMQFLGQPS